MIVGLGLDVVELSRIEKIWNRYGFDFAKKILHERELDTFPSKKPLTYLAGRFAAKEAISKALGTGMSKGIGFTDLCVINQESGQPQTILFGAAKVVMQDLGASKILVSITHSKDVAAAVAIIET